VYDPAGGLTKYSYDNYGNLSNTTDPSGHVTTTTYLDEAEYHCLS